MYKLIEPNELKQNILRIGKSKGLQTYRSIAKASGVSEETFCRWKSYYPNLYSLILVANALDCTLDELLMGELKLTMMIRLKFLLVNVTILQV